MKSAVLALLALLLTLGFADIAQAQAPPRPVPVSGPAVPSTVNVEVMVVHATKSSTVVDQRLSSLLPHLRHLDFTGFSVLNQQTSSLSNGQSATQSLVTGKTVTLDLISHNGSSARLRFRVFQDDHKILDTTVNVRRNRSFIVGGPEYDGGSLIMPITVRY